MLYSVFVSSAVAFAGLLIAAPAPVDALVAPGSGSELGHLAARRLAGVSPNHNALARRKRNAHKKRQRCQQRPVSASSTPSPQQTDYSGGTDVGGGNDNSGGYTPPANNDNSGGDNNTGNTYPSNPTTSQPATEPTTTPPAAPPATTNLPAPSTGNGKLILAWPNGADQSVPSYFTGKASYYYTWSPHKVDANTGSVKFCPMLWGYHQIADFDRLVVNGYADCVLGMNEVNQVGQAIMSVQEGIDLWQSHIAHLANEGYSILGSPATTSAPDGLTWVQAFLEGVSTKPNVITVHWYDVGFPKFKEYVENFHSGTGYRTIWVTEFACQNFNGGAQCSHDEVWAFVTEASRWMDQTEWIGGYAPFGFMREMQGVNEENRLMNWDGTPTDLGSWFIHSS
jgi:hypothetical protein